MKGNINDGIINERYPMSFEMKDKIYIYKCIMQHMPVLQSEARDSLPSQ